MLQAIILGSGAGGGVPQWNSAQVSELLSENGALAGRIKPRTQCGMAVSGNGKNYFLLNASPDLRQQILENSALWPNPALGQRNTPISGVILTGGEIDAIIGVLTLRESETWDLYASPSTLKELASNRIFSALNPEFVTRHALQLDQEFPLPLKDGTSSGLWLTAFAVESKCPLYAEGADFTEGQKGNKDDTLGLKIRDEQGKTLLFIPGCARITLRIQTLAKEADLLFFDGTLWDNQEMIRRGLSAKTGARMGHVSISESDGPLAAFAETPRLKKIFIHINNSNPVLDQSSAEHQTALKAGWIVGEDGMRFTLADK
ncbi:pyrroloquinoline quinone biosynthesis protein [Lasius niger]|uniref:Coenzyme PQQ synthesis protein B n=1 Tax=Lasius niger TaxID=67767 RepID=A0A0J7KKM9_LASNI|nr:pyrroloquinoline quinone biosynthesis protein [Lasius niger]